MKRPEPPEPLAPQPNAGASAFVPAGEGGASGGAPAAPARANRSSRWRKGACFSAFLALVVSGAYVFRAKDPRPPGAPKTGKYAARESGPAAVPVVAVRARRGDIGVYFTGLGAVTPLNTVMVHSRVDGELTAVHYQEGDMVKRHDLLVELDPRPFAAALLQAQGALARDQATLANARIDLARYQVLVPQKAVPEQTLATQEALVKQLEGTVELDQGAVDAAQTNLDYTKISAPIDGRVGLRLVDPGNIVHASDTNPMLVITQIQPISVIFTLSEDQLPQVLDKLRGGQTLPVEAWERDMSKKIAQGTLSTIDNLIDQTTGTVRIRATFDNAGKELFPNQFVNARVLVETKRGVVLLPSAAVQRGATSTFVYLINADGTVTVRNVSAGVTEGDQSEISSGLKPGDLVVMTGADNVQEGSTVNPQISGEETGKSGAGKQKGRAKK
ncbi:MAG TPA: MdtA/MuxA family multidrug efflux RND transporter periplasmic adaptor subunit [Bryobacteraceae bacterium]|nr:MdtA/MuxA family multidrug efflux RND transporter periplasmic adaptor subunit [Bryobacteraceae bacterium]